MADLKSKSEPEDVLLIFKSGSDPSMQGSNRKGGRGQAALREGLKKSAGPGYLIGTLDVASIIKSGRKNLAESGGKEVSITQKLQQELKSDWLIDPKEIVLKEFIASGAYGSVHRGIYKGMDVAVKLLEWGDDATVDWYRFQLRSAFIQEVTVWSTLNHKNVCQFIGAITGNTDGFLIPSTLKEHDGHVLAGSLACCLVLEYLAGGNLQMYLYEHRHQKLPYKQVIKFALDIAEGLAYLHSKHIVHRDVKPANLLLDKHKTVKVADFGISRIEAKDKKSMHNFAGTVGYMAPEVVKSQPYDHKADVYSFGILLWELYCCEAPLPSHDIPIEDVKSLVYQGLRPEIPSICPGDYAALMRSCWDQEPLKRPDMPDVIQRLTSLDMRHAHGMLRDAEYELRPHTCTVS